MRDHEVAEMDAAPVGQRDPLHEAEKTGTVDAAGLRAAIGLK
jgi:hypothetical protein